MDCIEKLYKNFAILEDAKDNILKHEAEYLEILDAVKGSQKEKRLAAQFITRFFIAFPKLAVRAIDAQFDLCEDDDISIRKQAIKDLPSFCRENKIFTYRVSDALTQLLQAEDPSEFTVVQNALIQLFRIDPKGSLMGIFNQIKNGEDGIRDKGLKFLMCKLSHVYSTVLLCKVEDLLISELKKVYQEASTEEIPILFQLMLITKLGKTPQGNKELVDFINEQLELENPINTSDEDSIERLTKCIKFSLKFFSKGINSNRFVSFMTEQILPKIRSTPGFDEGADNVLEVFKSLAEISRFVIPQPGVESNIKALYDLLLELLPLPEEGTTQEPKLQFSYVECLLYTLHELSKTNPGLLNDAAVLKDFRLRLQFFARALQGYIKTLRESLNGKACDESHSNETKLKIVALRTTTNINTLIKDFFHTPPVYKSTIVLSWHSTESKSSIENRQRGRKRILFKDPLLQHPTEKNARFSKSAHQELYQPPNGKYSSNIRPSFRGRGGYQTFRGRTWRRDIY